MYLNPKVAAGVVVEHQGGIVLLKREVDPRAGYWVYPGGFVDRGETVEAAAKREAFEEVGLDVEIGPLLGVYSYVDSEVVIVAFSGRVLGGTMMAGDEALEARVYPVDDLPWDMLAFPSTREALRDYMKQRRRSTVELSRQSVPKDIAALRAAADRALAAKDAVAGFGAFEALVTRFRELLLFDDALRAAEAGLELTQDPRLARIADEIAAEKAEVEKERC